MTDKPLLLQPSLAKECEMAAISAYRAKYPDGIPWQDLNILTRTIWMEHVLSAARKGGEDANG